MPSQSTYTLCGDIKITFTDSGAPLNSNGDYVTVVIVHGVGFVATGFEQLQSLASSNNIRIVALNRRGYQGSTPYTEEELNGFHSGTESSLRGIMLYLIDFVKTLVQNEAIPRISREGNGLRGGIALMGWSIGVLTTMSIFTLNPDNDREIYAFLGEYLRDFIIYDPPYMSFGYPLHQAFTSPLAYIPWTDPKLTTPESQANQFLRWATSSYSHETQTISPTSIDGFDFRKETDECFVDSWDGADTKRFYEPDTSGLAADVGMFYTLSSHLLNCTKKALYGTQNENENTFLPELRFTYLYAPRAFWVTVWTHLEARRLYEDKRAKKDEVGIPIRHVEFVEMDGANHCIHQQDPEHFMRFVIAALTRN